MKDLMELSNKVLEAMSADYVRFCDNREFADATNRVYSLQEGRNYMKIVCSDRGRESVCGFIVKKAPKNKIDNKTKEPFKVGDLLMAAGWSAPALNFARGNVETFKDNSVRWTGV